MIHAFHGGVDEEYEDCIFDVPNNWTKEQTDELFELCRRYSLRCRATCRFDLRWPIIMDHFSSKQYSLEDCQMVFLDVTKTVLECRRRHGKELTENEELYIAYKSLLWLGVTE